MHTSHHTTLGIERNDPESLAATRAKQKSDKKLAKVTKLQELTDTKAFLEEENEEKDMVIEGIGVTVCCGDECNGLE